MTDPSGSATVFTGSQAMDSPVLNAQGMADSASYPEASAEASTVSLASESASPDVAETSPQPLKPDSSHREQVRFKSEGGRLLLLLPSESESSPLWSELWQQLKHRLSGGDRFWQADTPVHLIARDRLLDARQLQEIADVLTDVQLYLKRVYTSRRQTAVAAATAGYSVEQHPPVAHLSQSSDGPKPPLAEPLYVQMTVRSGIEIRHPGTVVVLGDVNPGGSVIADGDVIVWGILRGVAQAGAAGNSDCLVMALRMEPTQIRIGDAVARSPETPPAQFYPEVAYATDQGIRITKASDFPKMRLSSLGTVQ